MLSYVWRDLLHNPRRTLASLAGIALGIGLFSSILFFVDGSAATMTKRALAPLSLDIQRVITATPEGGLRLTETLSGPAPLGSEQDVHVSLTVVNEGDASANEVVVSDVPPEPLTYVSGTTSVDGEPIPDVQGESPLSHGLAGFGLNIGRVEPGASVEISYAAQTANVIPDVRALPLRGNVSSREQVEPIPANAPSVLSLAQLETEVAMIPGVAAADGLSFVDLPPGSLARGGSIIDRPMRVFSFDQQYLEHYPSIRVVGGGFRAGETLVSVEAAQALEAQPGATIELSLPDRTRLTLSVSGVVDLARAQPLFSSRKASKLEEFLYVPDTIVVPPDMFLDEIIPAFSKARASVGAVTRSFPVQELDVLVDRTGLDADPGTALAQTRRVANAIDRVGPGQGYLIDNISNTLTVARDDAAVGKRMFLFLGLPGVLMAAFLAAYAGSILAAAERREHANLRVRGAHRGHLRRIAAYKALSFAGAGSAGGIGLGLTTAIVFLGWTATFDAAALTLLNSGLVAVALGAVITALALYIPAGRSVRREISEERREMSVPRVPAWRRIRLDLGLLIVAAAAEIVALRTGALDPPSGSVYLGVSTSLPSRLLIAPLAAWVGGVLVCVRLLVAIMSRLPNGTTAGFGSVVRGVLSRSVRRRTWALTTGIIGVGLVVAFGMNMAIFTATYESSKVADARFVVGSDLRITPSVLSRTPATSSDTSRFAISGVSAVSPVVFRLENSVLIGPFNQHRKNLAAIDAATFARVAPFSDSLFVGRSARESLAALQADPNGLLVDQETADDLQVETGDTVEVITALGTKQETQAPFHVVGLFDRFPAFPEGANLIVNLRRYQETTGLQRIDFFLAEVNDDTPSGMKRVIGALESGPGRKDPIHIDSIETALGKDQSSLTALNVNGLVGLNFVYTLLMSVAAMGIFVFGLLLQRRREYVTLRAQGVRMQELHAIVLGEAALVAAFGLGIGLLVGTGIAVLLVDILRALFILDPSLTLPLGRIAVLASLVLAAAVVSGLVATEILRRLNPTEILREE